MDSDARLIDFWLNDLEDVPPSEKPEFKEQYDIDGVAPMGEYKLVTHFEADWGVDISLPSWMPTIYNQ